LKISDRISFLGDRKDVPNLLSQAQIFILSTHYEGLPISILEAMRAGLPVVATRVNGIPEEVIHEKTGLLVTRNDVKDLASALEKVIQSSDMRQRMGEAGREKFLQEFTLERMLVETEAVYKQVIENKNAQLTISNNLCSETGIEAGSSPPSHNPH